MNELDIAAMLSPAPEKRTVTFGQVTAISGNYLSVMTEGATIAVINCCNPAVGDRVVMLVSGTQWVAVGVVGGEDTFGDISASSIVLNGTKIGLPSSLYGLTSAAALRNAMGLGNTTGALPRANGGSGVTTIGTTNVTAFRGLTLTLRKWGPSVDAIIAGTATAAIAAGTVCFSLPDGHQPVSLLSTIFGNGVTNWQNSSAADGNISNITAIASGGTPRCHFTYMTAQ
jgi:hypothetical protein